MAKKTPPPIPAKAAKPAPEPAAPQAAAPAPAPQPAPVAKAAAIAVAATAAVIASTKPALEAAGPQWCARFAGRNDLDALAEPFQSKVRAWLEALAAGGATYTISATLRPPERAYLMHYAGMVANGGTVPAEIPAMAGVAIDWTCLGNLAQAKAMAAAMCKGYGIVYPAALASRHTQGLAIDVTIVLPSQPREVPQYKDPDGKIWMLPVHDMDALVKFGAAFGVIKLLTDPPHWSSDGH